MAITLDGARQYPLTAYKDFAYTDLVSGTYAGLVKVPVGARVLGTKVIISTIFNSATTDQFSIGDQPVGSAARPTQYAAQSADVTAVPTQILGVATNYSYATGGTVGVLWTGAGAAPTTGAGTLFVEYIIEGRALEDNP
jgi:hypothetical protein